MNYAPSCNPAIILLPLKMICFLRVFYRTFVCSVKCSQIFVHICLPNVICLNYNMNFVLYANPAIVLLPLTIWYRQLRARRALSIFKDVPSRTRKVLSLYKVYGNSALLVLNGTSLNIDSALLPLNWRICWLFCFFQDAIHIWLPRGWIYYCFISSYNQHQLPVHGNKKQ